MMIDDIEYGLDPQGRSRFFGMYTANVLSNLDPLKKGRLQLQIFQPTGKAKTAWTPQCAGVLAQPNSPYGVFVSTSSQGVSGNTVVNFSSSPININGGIKLESSSRLKVTENGTYKIDFSANFDNVGTYAEVEMWVRKNGVDIPWSGVKSSVIGYISGHEVIGSLTAEHHSDHSSLVVNHVGTSSKHNVKSSFIVDMVDGDYLQLVMASDSANTTLKAYAASGPGVPSIIATVSLVGKYLPKPGTKVWVMFEAGDPEYPVWIGAVA